MSSALYVTPMSQTTKRKQVRVYLDDATENHLAEVLKRFPRYTESFLMTEILAAGLEACADNSYSFTLPLKFHILSTQGVMNETEIKYTKGKK
jgi:hypothetical protein